jgi:hypothetical protein
MDFLGLGTSENMLLEAPILGRLIAIRAGHFRIAQPEFKVALVVSSHFHFECHFASLLEFREWSLNVQELRFATRWHTRADRS